MQIHSQQANNKSITLDRLPGIMVLKTYAEFIATHLAKFFAAMHAIIMMMNLNMVSSEFHAPLYIGLKA